MLLVRQIFHHKVKMKEYNRRVENRIIDEKAHGEKHLAVNTGDDVRLQENRHVVVKFRK